LSPEQRIARKLRAIVAEAKRAGVALVADADAMGIRVMRTEDLRGEDLREVGELVRLHGGCGCAITPRIDASGNG